MSGPAGNSPRIGSTVGGKYRLLRRLGEGGMGTVFEAEHELTHKRVAIKWLHADLARKNHAARLIREAQAAARVRHPNVVDVYDAGRDGNALFLVMELLEGEPLSRALARGDLSIPAAIALILPAMRGVAALHKAGVVHRDIKPDNIFLAREGDSTTPVAKVLDFGISKVEPRGHEAPELTRTGAAFGTPLYMSYEQLTSTKDVDARADVYAFGVILYEAIAGVAPFVAESLPELAIKVATTDPIALKELRPDIPTALRGLVAWAMARHRDERIASMDALIAELEPFATEHGFRGQMTMARDTLPRVRPSRARGVVPRLPKGLRTTGALVTTAFSRANRALERSFREYRLMAVVFALASMLVISAGSLSLRSAAEAEHEAPAQLGSLVQPGAEDVPLRPAPEGGVLATDGGTTATPPEGAVVEDETQTTTPDSRRAARKRQRPLVSPSTPSARTRKTDAYRSPPSPGVVSGDPDNKTFRAGKALRAQF